jgi:hypothetical protein
MPGAADGSETGPDYIDQWNNEPKPFVWHKGANENLDTLAAYCARISYSGH